MRTFGVEEELLVVEPRSGQPLPLGYEIARLCEQLSPDPRFGLTTELQSEQIESVSGVCHSLEELGAAIHAGRSCADELARRLGGRIVAFGTSPVPVAPHISPGSRYQEISERFGLTAREHLTCGFHVHVAVESADEGVGVLDRIRPWLPVLLALSVNSPYWAGQPTGYASYRRQILSRLPLTGSTELFGSSETYRRQIDQLLSTGVIIDEAMVYFDARLSHLNPTVEIRVADVCLDVKTAILIAGLTRSLVEIAARQWHQNRPPAPAAALELNLAMWRASRDGLEGVLLAPENWKPQPAKTVVAALLHHTLPALRDFGDAQRVLSLLDCLYVTGTGDQFQRTRFCETSMLSQVVAGGIERTLMAQF